MRARRCCWSGTSCLAGFQVFETDASQLLGIILRDVETVHRDALIADDAGVPVGWHRIHPVRIHGFDRQHIQYVLRTRRVSKAAKFT